MPLLLVLVLCKKCLLNSNEKEIIFPCVLIFSQSKEQNIRNAKV